jgi:acetoin utilization deacetylase AcuC-like enzyme
MSVALFTHPDCVLHNTGEYHPECPDRLRVVLQALEHPRFTGLLREVAPLATREQLLRVHPAAHIDHILSIHPEGAALIGIDADTIMSAGSVAAALRAAGGAVAGVDAVMDGWARTAFVAVRPPGHHAEPDRAMGFCLFNNAAIAAHHARSRGARRVAVVDFDVHHGNGTQAAFFDDADFFYGSSHQSPCYPGTGERAERGVAQNILNVPLAPGSVSEAFRAAWEGMLIPALTAFAPEVLIVSAGFDAHKADPLAQLRVETSDFAWLTEHLLAVADAHCAGRLVSVLEGGYDLVALGQCAAAHVGALLRQ